MNTLLLVFFFFILLFGIRCSVKDLISKFTLYSFLLYWYVALISSTFSPYSLLEVSTFSYILLILATGSFVVGMIAASRSKFNKSSFDRSNITYVLERLLGNKLLLLFYILVLIYYAQFAVNAVAFAALQGHAEMEEQLDVVFMNNGNAQILFGYVVTPMLHISFVLLAYAFMTIKGHVLKLLLPIIVYLVFFIEYFVIAGGRSTIIIALVYFIFTYICLVPIEVIKKISIRKVVLIAVLGIVVSVSFTYMNMYRTYGSFEKVEKDEDSSGGVAEMMARYSLSPIVMFDRSIKQDYVGKFGYQYGRASLMGFDTWVATGLRQVGISHKTASHITEYLEDNYFVYDKKGTSTNYAYTGVFYHYVDLGIIGVIFFPLFFGFFYRKMILYFYNKPNIYSFLLLGIGYFMMMHSLFTCYFIKGWVALYIIILTILMSREKNRMSKVKAL